MLKNNIIKHDPFAVLDTNVRNFLSPFLQQAKEAGKTVNFCGQQATDLDSAEFLVNAGISHLTCGVDSLVPLRLQLSGVTIA